MSQPGDDRITVLLADQHSLFREAVRSALEAQPDIVVVCEAGDGMHAFSQARETNPHVALLDRSLPQRDGIKTLELMKAQEIPTRVIILTDREDLQTLMSALEAGAAGFLSKNCAVWQLIEAVRSVDKGETLVPPSMVGPLLDQLFGRRRERDQALRRLPQLTRRERVVLALLADGASNPGIAKTLGISTETARTHVQNLLGKLGVHSKLEAAAFVIQHGVMEVLLEGEPELSQQLS